MHGEIEGRTEKLTKWEMETEAARRRLSAWRGGRRSSKIPGRRLRPSTVLGKRKNESGGSREGRRWLRVDLKRPGARGGTLPRRGVGRLRHAARPGGSEERGGEDGADKRARAVSGWARGRGRLPGAACWAGVAAGPSSWGARLAGRAGKRERRVSGPRGKKAMWAENEEGEEIIIFPFYFPNKFSQKHFQIIFEFI